MTLASVRAALRSCIDAPLPAILTDEVLRSSPLAVWAELELGLEEGLRLMRRHPVPFDHACRRLAEETDLPVALCRERLTEFLTRVSLPKTERGGSGSRAFLAFKLHQFIAGAGELYTTLSAPPRPVLLEGQIELPGSPGTLLFPTRFCRSCWQEFHVATLHESSGGRRGRARSIDETPSSHAREGERPGI